MTSSTDKIATYGLTGLVLGGVGLGVVKAAKVGLLAAFWKPILAFFVAAKKVIIAAHARCTSDLLVFRASTLVYEVTLCARSSRPAGW